MPFNLEIIDKLLHDNDSNKTQKKPKKRRNKSVTKPKIEDKSVEHVVKKTTTKTTGKSGRNRDMDASMFRFINEKLSLMSSEEARQYFQTDPAAFSAYHRGFSNQRDKWPDDPLEWTVARVKALRGLGALELADFGCGAAILSDRLQGVVKRVRNFDLVATRPDVEACDISQVPLSDDSVGAVVISLALMGTNCNEYVAEANRVLKMSGSLFIIELVSRIEGADKFTKQICKMGFRLEMNLKNESQKNAYFLKLHFVKTSKVDRSNLPILKLKPVSFKKR